MKRRDIVPFIPPTIFISPVSVATMGQLQTLDENQLVPLLY